MEMRNAIIQTHLKNYTNDVEESQGKTWTIKLHILTEVENLATGFNQVRFPFKGQAINEKAIKHTCFSSFYGVGPSDIYPMISVTNPHTLYFNMFSIILAG